MMFLSRVVPALLAASSLVKAAAVARGDTDSFVSEFIDALNKKNLTYLANSYEKVANDEEGKPVFDQLENHGPITLLAPENCAFEPDYPKLGAETLLYNAIFGSIDDGFKSSVALTRRGAAQSHSVAPSGAGMSGGGGRKRDSPNYQAQVVDQTFTPGSRKRTYNPSIEISQSVGSAKVVDRFTFKNLVILIIDTVLSLPGKMSDLLCKPLIKDAPEGFKKFGGGLQKAGLLDDLDDGKLVTAFIPIDDSLDCIDKLSGDDLKCFLENHFFFGKRVFSPLFDSIGKATAVSGKELGFSFENGIHYVCCGDSKSMLLRTDVIAGNGVLHVIDKPLKCD